MLMGDSRILLSRCTISIQDLKDSKNCFSEMTKMPRSSKIIQNYLKASKMLRHISDFLGFHSISRLSDVVQDSQDSSMLSFAFIQNAR